MAQDLNGAIDKLKEMLSSENGAEQIAELMKMFGNSKSTTSAKEQDSGGRTNEMTSNNEIRTGLGVEKHRTDEIPSTYELEHPKKSNPLFQGDNQMESLIKIKKVIERISDNDDPRINLLMALKPYLKQKRLNNIDYAVKMVHLTKLSSVINDFDKL